jgi:hypothetical protein
VKEKGIKVVNDGESERKGIEIRIAKGRKDQVIKERQAQLPK